MGKFKVGDRVRIRPDLKQGHTVHTGYEVYVSSSMMEFRGGFAKIMGAWDSCYKLDIDDSVWNWSEDLLLPKTPCVKLTKLKNELYLEVERCASK